DAGAVRPHRALVAVVEQLHPRLGAPNPQRLEVVGDLEQAVAARTAVDEALERVLVRAALDAAQPGTERLSHGGSGSSLRSGPASASGRGSGRARSSCTGP